MRRDLLSEGEEDKTPIQHDPISIKSEFLILILFWHIPLNKKRSPPQGEVDKKPIQHDPIFIKSELFILIF